MLVFIYPDLPSVILPLYEKYLLDLCTISQTVVVFQLLPSKERIRKNPTNAMIEQSSNLADLAI